MDTITQFIKVPDDGTILHIDKSLRCAIIWGKSVDPSKSYRVITTFMKDNMMCIDSKLCEEITKEPITETWCDGYKQVYKGSYNKKLQKHDSSAFLFRDDGSFYSSIKYINGIIVEKEWIIGSFCGIVPQDYIVDDFIEMMQKKTKEYAKEYDKEEEVLNMSPDLTKPKIDNIRCNRCPHDKESKLMVYTANTLYTPASLWYCNECDSKFNQEQPHWYCSDCSYDICKSCGDKHKHTSEDFYTTYEYKSDDEEDGDKEDTICMGVCCKIITPMTKTRPTEEFTCSHCFHEYSKEYKSAYCKIHDIIICRECSLDWIFWKPVKE